MRRAWHNGRLGLGLSAKLDNNLFCFIQRSKHQPDLQSVQMQSQKQDRKKERHVGHNPTGSPIPASLPARYQTSMVLYRVEILRLDLPIIACNL